MFDQHDREELDRIERWFKMADPVLVRAFEAGRLPGTSRGPARAATVAGYVVAATLLVVGAAMLNLMVFMLGSVVLSGTGCWHVVSRIRRRRHNGWPTT